MIDKSPVVLQLIIRDDGETQGAVIFSVSRSLGLRLAIVCCDFSPLGHREYLADGEDEQGIRPHTTAGE